MKIVKSASGRQNLKISKQEWERIGKTAGWFEDEELEDGGDRPDILDDDYVITDRPMHGYTLTCGNKTLGEGLSYDDAISMIEDRMERDQFWPNVWEINDHGNISLLAKNEHGEWNVENSWV